MTKQVTYIKAGVQGPDVRMHGYDHFGRNVYVPRCFIYKEKLDERRIQKALEEMMPKFPLLTGRIVKDEAGYDVIRQNDLGMRFEVRYSKENYKDYCAADNFSKKAQHHVYFKLLINQNCPIVTVTITHFKDRGSIFGYSNIHSVMDGQSNIYFLTSLVKQIHGEPIPEFKFDRNLLAFSHFDFKNQPSHEAVVVLSKKAMAKMYLKFIYGIAFGNEAKMIKIDGRVLDKMKAFGMAQSEPTVSTMDILAAILWKSVATIRKEQQIPLFNYTINLRFKTSLDQNYIGNASTGYQLYAASDFLNQSIVDIARKIRDGLAQVDDEYGAKEAQYLNELVAQKKIGSAMQKELVEIVDGGAIMFNSTYKYPFYQLDFGTGTPTWYDMPPGPLNGIFYVIPDADGKSINLGFGIAKKEMKLFLKLFQEALQPFL